jgi:hypothetical protein
VISGLLSDDALDVPAVVERARRMGHDLTGSHTLSAIAMRDADRTAGLPGTERALATTTRFIADLKPLPLAAVHRGLVVILWPANPVRRDGGYESRLQVTGRLVDVLAKPRSVAQVTADHDMDRRATARVLRVHPNTVLQRMHRGEGTSSWVAPATCSRSPRR